VISACARQRRRSLSPRHPLSDYERIGDIWVVHRAARVSSPTIAPRYAPVGPASARRGVQARGGRDDDDHVVAVDGRMRHRLARVERQVGGHALAAQPFDYGGGQPAVIFEHEYLSSLGFDDAGSLLIAGIRVL
jgi:hypothetical protein